jgi:hypothetical protein
MRRYGSWSVCRRAAVLAAFASLFVLSPGVQAGELDRAVAARHAKGATFGEWAPFQALGRVSEARRNGLARLGAHATLATELRDGTLLEGNTRALRGLRVRQPETLRLLLPYKERSLAVDFFKVNILAPDFSVLTSTGKAPVTDLGVHYRGALVGDEHSWAALSVYGDHVVAMIGTADEGNIVLAAAPGVAGDYVVYGDDDLVHRETLRCALDHRAGDARLPLQDVVAAAMDEQGVAALLREAAQADLAAKEVRIYVEVTNALVNNKGGAAGATSYVTSLFNLSSALYANEQIPTVLSQIFNNTSADSYSTSPSTALSQFQQRRAATFNGNLGQLVGLGSNGGIAAGFAGFCASNRANSLCTSNVGGALSSLPTWSYPVEVFTHELGHLMGSRHTHACVWNGNNTAIDGCSGFVEGSCALPNVPASQGTIMSYCQGFSFNNGFGSQPGNVIRSRFASATCLGSGSTCTNTYTGSLPATNAVAYAPSSSGRATAAGTIRGVLSGTGQDFDLFLERLSGSTWSVVARSEGSTSNETVTFNATAGTYRWRVLSYAGSGSFSLCVTWP